MIKSYLVCGAAVLWSVTAGADSAKLKHVVNPETRIESWETTRHGVYIKLMQITPAQALAFYLARDFPAKHANQFADACIFMTLLRNDAAPGSVEFDLSDWRLMDSKSERPLKQRDAWRADWEQAGLSEAARVAFHWAQFPTRHIYERGDWNQGMQSYGSAPGQRFSVKFVWKADEITYHTVLEGLRCAPDDR